MTSGNYKLEGSQGKAYTRRQGHVQDDRTVNGWTHREFDILRVEIVVLVVQISNTKMYYI